MTSVGKKERLFGDTPTHFSLQTSFFKDIDIHMRALCNGALKEESNVFVAADRITRRIKYIIDSQIKESIDPKVENKFQEYLGVREKRKDVMRKDEEGNPVLDAKGRPISDTEITYIQVGVAHLLRVAMQDIMKDYTKDIEKDLQEFFEEGMRQEDAIKNFVNEIVETSTYDLRERLRTQTRNNFAIRTGEFHHYTSPPMGNNEFLRKIVDNDILKLGDGQ